MQELSRFISALHGPSAIIDESGCIVAHNDAFANYCQHPGASLQNAQLNTVLTPADLHAFKQCLNNSNDQAKDPSAAVFTRTSLGFKLIEPDSSHSPRLVLCHSDILAAEDQILHFFLEHLDQGFWDYDTRRKEFVVTDAWRTMRGIDPDFDINSQENHGFDDVHPDDRESLSRLFESQVRGETESFTLQYRRRHLETDQWIWLYCRAKVIESDSDGRPLRIVGSDTDITEIKNDQNRLAQLNGKLDLAIEIAGIGVFEFDLNTSRVHWDDCMLDIYGLPAGEHMRPGDEWETLIHPDDAEDTLAYVNECALTGMEIKRDFRIIRPDGEVRHLRTMCRQVTISPTESKLIGVNIDLTDDVMRRQELETTRQQLEHDSRHDALTGLANRRLLDETIAEYQAHQNDLEMCVMHIDLDYFKNINDTLGHAAGDAVLVHVARTLARVLDEATLITRFGGDEFVVLFAPALAKEHARALAERVIAAFKPPFLFEGQACTIGVSIGSAVGRDKETAFANADIALYAAKNAGRSQYRAFTVRARARADGYLRRRQDLADAISENKIECWYQPQYDATTHQLIGAEALARLRLNETSLWSPDEFLPLAEQTGLLSEIEEFIFCSVLRDQTDWNTAGLYYPRVSVNISHHRLAERNLIERIKHQVKPHHVLSLEILENIFLDDPNTPINQRIQTLRDLGLGIELDDFGSGHASVVSLLAVNPDKIKIDQRLTKDIVTSEMARTVLRALVSIGRAQNVGIVLEGIETEDQLAITREIDCDVLQGYALSPPLSAADFSAMLEERTRKRVGAP